MTAKIYRSPLLCQPTVTGYHFILLHCRQTWPLLASAALRQVLTAAAVTVQAVKKGYVIKVTKKSGAILAWRRPSEAKAYFLQELQARNDEELRALTAALLGGLQWLFFPITMSSSSNSNDGTEDLAVIFERLAQRDATCCRPHRRSEYADMGAADFVRNLVKRGSDLYFRSRD